ncbi:COG3904 family protein [Bradyrhizobium betae]|uniref:ATP-dependent Clp protease proteolytic subunit n=1 Tax=Bradyrhizobium betae TaxID=244734 RepID=A0A5P6P497_9BRAD|nr:ATP-dependent Clp protease proteolytic subunit [Bradyrhizobium betae]MCS3731219.1 hypothetical protein [Bradyrhizobium betae]QFI73177.1 hypothetical protein F8237_12690 [Bradyrhizobium betae]
MRAVLRYLVAAVAVGFGTSAAAAEMHLDKGNPVSVLKITGPIEKGDAKKFEQLAQQVPVLMMIVQLNSPGGELTSGLAIAEQIKVRGYSTAVRPGDMCASACALAWLAGDGRYMEPASQIGFHAASRRSGTQSVESGEANALVGAFLGQLGLSTDAIRYITHPSPSEVQWLTIKDAMRLGINVTIANEKQLAR